MVVNMGALFSLGQITYYAGWFFKSKFGVKDPLVNTMVINYECNLDCQHCNISDNLDKVDGPLSISYEKAVDEMKYFYDQGARILFFEGGEPTIWKDGGKRLPDLVDAGREIGYYVTGYTTNGVGDIFENSDVISVSLDGPQEIHDQVRGEGVFKQMMDNLELIDHPNIFSNMVVTRTNLPYLRDTVEVVDESGNIRGIMLNFLTPPPHSLSLDKEQKENVVEMALQMKREGLPVLNTDRALKDMLVEDFEGLCPTWISAFVMPDGTRLYGCPLRGEVSCSECGFNAVREYRLIAKGSFKTITQMSKRFALSKQ